MRDPRFTVPGIMRVKLSPTPTFLDRRGNMESPQITLPTELAPLVIMIKHEGGCSARGGGEALCKCRAILSAVSERLPDWRMSVVLPWPGDEVDADTVVFTGIH